MIDRDGGQFRVGLERVQDRPAVHLRHHHVEQDGAGRVPAGEVEPRGAVGGRHGRETLPFEEPDRQVALRRIVVDHQDGGMLARNGTVACRRKSLVLRDFAHGGGQRDREGGTLAEVARHRDIAPEQPREGPGDREAEARATELPGGGLVGLGEALEQPAHLFVRHADPRVPDLEGQEPVGSGAMASRRQHDAAVLRELRRIADEVEQALPELDDVGPHGAEVFGEVELQNVVLLLDQPFDRTGHLAHQRRHVDRLGVGVHAVRLDLREVEHVVDEA